VREKEMCSKAGRKGEVSVLIDMGMGAEILLLDSGEDMIMGCRRVRCIACSVERSLLCRGQRYFPFYTCETRALELL